MKWLYSLGVICCILQYFLVLKNIKVNHEKLQGSRNCDKKGILYESPNVTTNQEGLAGVDL